MYHFYLPLLDKSRAPLGRPPASYNPSYFSSRPLPSFVGRQVLRSSASRARVNGKTIRVRQHANPLSHFHLNHETHLPAGSDWSQVFSDMKKPFWLDIGCAKGDYLIDLAKKYPGWNFLGVEIRRALVQHANENGACHSNTPSQSFVLIRLHL